MSKKKKIYKSYEELLHSELKDPEVAVAYLNEALAEEDQTVFLIALKDVLDAWGEDMATLAKEAHLNRQNLYRMLSQKGNPRWNSLTSLFGAMGLQIQLTMRK